MEYDKFLDTWMGKSIDWDGAYGAQCVDLVAQYCSDNGKPVAYANAKDWWENPALTGAFDFIPNDPTDPNQLPNRGEIVIFSGAQPGSGGYGHIDIFDENTGATWTGCDQNWGGQYVHFVYGHVWTYVLGWMRLKAEPAPIPAPNPAPDPAPEPVPEPTPQPEPTPEPQPVPEPTPEPPPVVEPPVESPTPAQGWVRKLIEWLKRFFGII